MMNYRIISNPFFLRDPHHKSATHLWARDRNDWEGLLNPTEEPSQISLVKVMSSTMQRNESKMGQLILMIQNELSLRRVAGLA